MDDFVVDVPLSQTDLVRLCAGLAQNARHYRGLLDGDYPNDAVYTAELEGITRLHTRLQDKLARP